MRQKMSDFPAMIGKNPENKLLRDFMASHGMTADDVPIVPFRVIEKYGENVFRDFDFFCTFEIPV